MCVLLIFKYSHTLVSETQNLNLFTVGATLSFVRHMEGQKCSYITQDHILFSLLFYLSRLLVCNCSKGVPVDGQLKLRLGCPPCDTSYLMHLVDDIIV